MADFKQTNVVFTDTDYDKKKKVYTKKDIKLNFYEFPSVELKMFDKPEVNNDSVRVGHVSIPGQDSCAIWENDGDYGTYRSGTVDKGQLYFNVKKGLARIGKSSPITVTFREAINEGEDAIDALDTEKEDIPF
jgi:hypothetical protein